MYNLNKIAVLKNKKKKAITKINLLFTSVLSSISILIILIFMLNPK